MCVGGGGRWRGERGGTGGGGQLLLLCLVMLQALTVPKQSKQWQRTLSSLRLSLQEGIPFSTLHECTIG